MGKGCYQLGNVEDTTAADTYYAISTELACLLHNGVEVVERGLSHNLVEHFNIDTCCLQVVQRRFDKRTDGRSCQHKQPLESHLLVIFY